MHKSIENQAFEWCLQIVENQGVDAWVGFIIACFLEKWQVCTKNAQKMHKTPNR
jgi:hypothetical protein